MHISPGTLRSGSFQAIRAVPCRRARFNRSCAAPILRPSDARPAAMVIISTAVDDADPLAAANNGARAPRSSPAANNFDPAAAMSLFDVVHGTTTATADDVGAGGTTPWYYAGSGAYASWFPPPPLQSHGNDLACYAESIMDTSFPRLPARPAVYMQPELSSSLYYPQQGFPASCFAAAPMALEPTTIRPELQVLPPALHYYPQTQATTTGSKSVEEASPAVADTQRAQEHDTTRPAPRRRGRPSKRARLVSVSDSPVSKKPTKRVAVGSNRTASSSSQRTSSAATGSATMSSAADQVPVQRPEEAGANISSNGSTGTNSPMAAEQDAIAPPEPEAMVTGPQYADTSAVGVRFQPKDEELIDYLTMKYDQRQMPVNFFKEFEVYQAHPVAIKGACGESQDGCWYAFSRRDRRYKNGKRPARSVFVEGPGGDSEKEQVGFWKSNSKLGEVREGGRKDGAVIGRMTSLTFQHGRQPKGKQTGWKMKEYTIPENQHQPDGSAMLLNDWVVCKLFYKERPNTESETDENATSVGLGQERPMQGNGKKDKNAIPVAPRPSTAPRRSGKRKKDKNVIPVALGQEDGPGAAVGDGEMQGEEGMQQMVTPAHQASDDYSEQDLCVEDYPVCDVAFAQHNHAANSTI